MVDVADTRVRANNADTASNTPAVVVADVRGENDSAGMENAQAIGAVGDCRKRLGGIAIWKISRFGGVEVEKEGIWAAIGVTTPVCNG